jgi:hypothetical protein
MLSILASHNPDIEKLITKGYAVSIDTNNLVVRDIPYLDSEKQLQTGAFISKLVFIDSNRVQLDDHQIYFCGGHPCELDGSQIRNLGGGQMTMPLESKDLIVQRSFSNKPANGFRDLFEKIESYMTIVCGPAMELYKTSPFTFRIVEEKTNSVFKYRDTLTSRAEIGDLSSNFHSERVAIIGLGGTGAYLLDFLVKTPVAEILGFDLDPYHVHNAYRSPGMLSTDDFGKEKAEVYQRRYEGFRHGIQLRKKFIDAESAEDFHGVTFAFVCVDKGTSRKGIFDLLMKLKIPFIDVGMGLQRDKGTISGTARVTTFPAESAQEILLRNLVPMTDLPDDVYRSNIQISELNALNACLAIIKYKQLREFYADDRSYYHSLYTIDNSTILGENGKD